MIRRFKKEFRIIRAPFFAAVLCVPLTLFITEDASLRWNVPIMIQLVCCAIMGSAIFGEEFEYGAMEKLLAEPFSRIRLWREKMIALGLCAGCAALVNAINPEYFVPMERRGFFFPNPDRNAYVYIKEWKSVYLDYIIPIALASAAFLCAGLFMSLYVRKTHTAFWGALSSTIFIMILWQFVTSVGASLLGISSVLYSEEFRTWDKSVNMSLPLLLWCAFVYILARRKFLSLEV